MKQLTLILAAFSLVAGTACVHAQFYPRGGSTSSNSITIKPDGSGVARVSSSEPRAMMEEQLRSYEKHKSREDSSDDEDTDVTPQKEEEPKPMADDELEKKMRAMFTDREERYNDMEARQEGLQSIHVTKDAVEMVMTNGFASLADLLGGSAMMSSLEMGMSNIRFEKDTNSHLRITFTPYISANQDEKKMRANLKRYGSERNFKLILPGKILSSDFPETRDNTTGFNLDPKSDTSIDKFVKLQTNATVVIAELGGLVISEPLDSKTLMRARYRPTTGPDSDIPITDAGPGFITEASGLTTATTYYFPGGEEYLKKMDRSFSYQEPGVTVRARMFGPKGREIESLTDVKIIKAVDDKSREVEKFKMKMNSSTDSSEEGESDVEQYSQRSFSGRDAEKAGTVEFELQLALPKPDAESIAEVSVEAVAKTSGSWKEMALKDLKKGATNEVDLSELIPGAKMIVTKYTVKDHSYSLSAQIDGPAALVPKIKVEFKTNSKERANSNVSENSPKKTGDKMTRKLSVNSYVYSEDDATEPQVTVLVRFPQDQKRERVRFKLTGLDLF